MLQWEGFIAAVKKLSRSYQEAELTTAGLAKVYPDQLDHVGLQEVDVPPGALLHLSQGAGGQVKEGAGAAIYGFLGNTSFCYTALHGGFASSDVQH